MKIIPTKKYLIYFIILLLIISSGCTKKIYDVVYPTLEDGRYDSEFPYKNASEQLEEIANSVKMMNYVSYYKAYVFDENKKITESVLTDKKIKEIAVDELYYSESVSGTATIIHYDNTNVGLLTCAHIGNFPDTVLTYVEQFEENQTKYIKQMAIKVREHYFVNQIPGDDDFKVVVSDTKRDLAILTKRAVNDPFQRIKPFNYPFGESSNLELGNFVYIIGYPMGHKMITKGIISNTRDNNSNSFLIDALFNRGFSGGIILAIKDGVPNFELVGMAKSVSAKNEYFLTPSQLNDESEYDPNLPYSGDIHIKKFEGINYGITYTISTDEILNFFRENEVKLAEEGINLKYLTNNK